MGYCPERDITPPMPTPGIGNFPDTLSRRGAERLAAKIREFWHSRGYLQVETEIVETKLVPDANHNYGRTVWTVQIKNVKRGVPVRERRSLNGGSV